MSIAIDVAIIGGGSAGMSLAAKLATLDTGQQVRVFEPNTTASRNATGVSGRMPPSMRNCDRRSKGTGKAGNSSTTGIS